MFSSTGIIIIIILVSLAFICAFFYFKFKGIGTKRYLELMDIGNDLKEEIQNFISKKTSVKFIFIDLGFGERYDKIKCDWLNSEFSIENKEEFICELNNKDEKETNQIEALIKQKIILIKNDLRREFYLDVYLHQDNNFYVIKNIQEEKAYSLDTVYYSKDKNLIPDKLLFNNDELSLDKYNIDNMKRICLVNIGQDNCVKFINKISNLKLNGKETIFENIISDIFLNIRIIDKDTFNCSIFLNQDSEKGYLLGQQDINLINYYYNEIIINNINKYKNYKIKDITSNMEENFSNYVKDFTSRNLYDDSNKNILDRETIPIINQEDDIMNDIFDPSLKKKENKKEMSLNFVDIEKQYNLLNLRTLEKNFFNSPIHKKYLNEPSQEDLEAIEKMCLLSISLMTSIPLASMIFFYQIKTKILNQVKDYPIKEKIKIIICIKSHLNESIPSKLKLQKMIDLPEYSPYLCGELMYRNIIKSLTVNSKLNLIFKQLNSGGGFDYLNNDYCYFLKMIPLIVIKSHLLKISEDYFFIYSNNKVDEYAYTESLSRIISINEIKIFGTENILYKKSEDNSIKIGLIHFHEKGGHQKYGKTELSPRLLTSNDLKVYDNKFKDTDSGESGLALEVILFGEKNIISKLMACENLKILSNYKLFAEEIGSNVLFEEIQKILKDNKINLIYSNDKKTINTNSEDFDGRKIRYLKTYGIEHVKALKEKIKKMKEEIK